MAVLPGDRTLAAMSKLYQGARGATEQVAAKLARLPARPAGHCMSEYGCDVKAPVQKLESCEPIRVYGFGVLQQLKQLYFYEKQNYYVILPFVIEFSCAIPQTESRGSFLYGICLCDLLAGLVKPRFAHFFA